MEKRWRALRSDAKAIGIIALAYIVFYAADIGCPIKFVTGVSCPGCGMTRAWLHLLRFDIAGAAVFHPLFLLPIPLFLLLLFQERIPRRLFTVGIVCIAGAFFIVYGLRLMDPQDTVVVCEPENGLFGRIYRMLRLLLRA